ncbi:MAG TPA: flagellar protein FlgN [Bacillota bacterium]
MTALAGVLEGYCRVYEDLLVLARRKRDILLGGRPQDLEPVVQAEEVLLGRLGGLERELADARRGMAGEPDAADAPLAAVLDQLEPAERQRVEALGSRLRSVIEDLRAVGEENVNLLRQALQFVEFSISLLERTTAGATYRASGRLAHVRGPVVDHRA